MRCRLPNQAVFRARSMDPHTLPHYHSSGPSYSPSVMSASPSNFTSAPGASRGEESSTRTCTNCAGRKALHHFVSGSGKRSLRRCASCRESDAASKAKKKLAERSPSSSLRSTIVVGPLEQPSSATPATPYSTGPTTPATPTPSLPPRFAPAGRREHREPQFLPRGQDSQDPPEVAEARAERAVIQRQNRVARRQGESPLPTPSLASIVRRRDGGSDEADDDVSDVDRIGMISESRLRRY